jgi:STE24 endopeptidase
MPLDAYPLTWIFLLAIILETATRLWLASRQIAAVQAHRNTVPELLRAQITPQDQMKAADYTVARVRFGRWTTLYEALLKIVLTLGGGIAAIDAAWTHSGISEPWRGALIIGSVLVALQLLELPFALWRTFVLEAKFGFNRTTGRVFAADLGKSLVLGVALGGPLVLAALLLMQRAGATWWLWAWALWLIWTLLLTWAAPRFIAPLFNRFSPLTDVSLKARVETLLQRCGFTASGGVFVMDGSSRSAHGNAYFTGIGRNKRIVFFDTLLARIEPSEIEAVLAHELGHFKLHHVRQRLVVTIFASLAALALMAWAARQPALYAALGVPQPSAEMALILFALVTPVFAYFVTPLGAWWSRRHEVEADEFAAAHADPADLVTALVKLFRDNASTLTPDRLYSAFYDSHPPALQRIARLQKTRVRPHLGADGLNPLANPP